jgi:peptidoglycan hydrolase CwlO-like protein
MNKNVKTAFIVVGIAVLAFMLMSFSKKSAATPATLSDEEKNNLFQTAKGPQFGTQPPDDILQQIEKERAEALEKIKALNLQAEYEAYLKSRENDPLPS